jgi:hypothetical protein
MKTRIRKHILSNREDLTYFAPKDVLQGLGGRGTMKKIRFNEGFG